MAAYIITGIRLRIAELLCLIKRLFIAHVLFKDPGKDVVGCSVEDPLQRKDRIIAVQIAQISDPRDPAGNTGLRKKLRILLFRQFKKIHMSGQQFLVGTDYILPLFKTLSDIFIGRRFAAHTFDDRIDAFIIDDPPEIRCKAIVAAGTFLSGQYPYDLDVIDLFIFDDVGHAFSDRTVTQ